MNRAEVKLALRTARPRRRKPPRQVPPRVVALDYRRRLMAVLDLARRMAIDRLGGVLGRRSDEARLPLEAAKLAAREEDVRAAIAELLVDWRRAFGPQRAEEMARLTASAGSDFNLRQVVRQFRELVGVDVREGIRSVQPVTEAFVRENVGLIVTLPERLFADIETFVVESVLAGQTSGQAALAFEHAYANGRWNAYRIARDQTNKLNGDLTRHRNQALGITRYTWHHSGNRVNPRPEHVERDGRMYEWAKAPPGGHPGTETLCGCSSSPVLED